MFDDLNSFIRKRVTVSPTILTFDPKIISFVEYPKVIPVPSLKTLESLIF